MFVPAIFEEALWDDALPFEQMRGTRRDPLFGNRADRLMKTDVRELDGAWELDVDLPGFRKENIEVTLRDGVLTVSARKDVETECGERGRCVRRERHTGSLSRSFRVGDAVREEDVSAKYENGVLGITIAKREPAAAQTRGRIAVN